SPRDCLLTGRSPAERHETLEIDNGTKTDHQRVRNWPILRRRNAATGMKHQLQIWLQYAAARNAYLVGDLEHRFVIPYRALDTGEPDLIAVEKASITDPRPTRRDPQHVSVAAWEKALIIESGVDLKADQIAIGRGVAQP